MGNDTKDFKTCEEYVLNELKEAHESVDRMQEELYKIKNENEELKEFLNELLSKTKIDKAFNGNESVSLHLYSFVEEELPLLEKIKKYQLKIKENKDE